MSDADRESYVALFDILGFSSMVEKRKVSDVAEDLIYMWDVAGDHTRVDALVFSDTLLLYSEGVEAEQFAWIVEQGCKVVARCNEKQILLRGGIARGEFYVHKAGVFLGKAMIQGYRLEQSQDWMGGIVDPKLAKELQSGSREEKAIWDKLVENEHLVEYEAPIKGGPAGNLWCLGWPRYGNHEREIPTLSDWSVIRKFANTDKFAASRTW